MDSDGPTEEDRRGGPENDRYSRRPYGGLGSLRSSGGDEPDDAWSRPVLPDDEPKPFTFGVIGPRAVVPRGMQVPQGWDGWPEGIREQWVKIQTMWAAAQVPVFCADEEADTCSSCGATDPEPDPELDPPEFDPDWEYQNEPSYGLEAEDLDGSEEESALEEGFGPRP